jgi:hypothetical protein
MTSKTPRIDSLEGARNQIINGDFDFWQRGTSTAFTTNGNYLADRWQNQRSNTYGGTFTVTVSRQADAPTVAQSGHKSTYSQKMQVTANAQAVPTGAALGMVQYIEGYSSAEIYGKDCICSFWFKASATGTFSVVLGAASSTLSYVVPFAYNVANTWQKISFEFTFDCTESGQDFANGRGLSFAVIGSCGASLQTSSTEQWLSGTFLGASGMIDLGATLNAYLQIAQIFIGESASNSSEDLVFSRSGKTIQQELTACQRYLYSVQPDTSGISASFGVGQCISTTQARVSIPFPSQMRTTPASIGTSAVTSLALANATGTTTEATAISLSATGSGPGLGVVLVTVASGLVAGNAAELRKDSDASAFIYFDAEL